MGAVENPEAVFLAKMTASATHELRNILAVVKESAGLVEDLMLVSQQQRPVNPEKLVRAAQRIDAQVGRAAALLTDLNGLAHGLDHDEVSLSLGGHAAQTARLYERFARQRRMRLEVSTGGVERSIRANGLRLHMAIAAAIDCCLEQLPEESAIEIRVAGSTGQPHVTIGAATVGQAASAPAGAPSWSRCAAFAAPVGASVESIDAPFAIRLVFGEENADP